MTGITQHQLAPVLAKDMTLRDYFAAMAMQGAYASGNLLEDDTDDIVAEDAYLQADAMMKARAK